MRPRFCPACAAALPSAPPVTCGACGYAQFVNPRPSGSPLVLGGDRLLIVRRAREPKAGQWELPGGFCDGWETPAAAAVREAREELGVDVELGEMVGMYVDSYDFQGETIPVLDCFWLAHVVGGELRLDTSELLEHRWVRLSEVPSLAFGSMNAAVRDARSMVDRLV